MNISYFLFQSDNYIMNFTLLMHFREIKTKQGEATFFILTHCRESLLQIHLQKNRNLGEQD